MYKKWPSSSSSVQVVSKLVHMLCTNWTLAWAHVYISKQFPSLGTLSVTAWTQLVHICEQVSFQVGHSNFYGSERRGLTIFLPSVGATVFLLCLLLVEEMECHPPLYLPYCICRGDGVGGAIPCPLLIGGNIEWHPPLHVPYYT